MGHKKSHQSGLQFVLPIIYMAPVSRLLDLLPYLWYQVAQGLKVLSEVWIHAENLSEKHYPDSWGFPLKTEKSWVSSVLWFPIFTWDCCFFHPLRVDQKREHGSGVDRPSLLKVRSNKPWNLSSLKCFAYLIGVSFLRESNFCEFQIKPHTQDFYHVANIKCTGWY